MRHARSSITPPVESVAMSVEAADGFHLGATVYSPARARGTVLVHGATAVPQSYYARYAAFLTDLGVRVVTYDYRGVGRSRPDKLRGFAATMTDWAALDAHALHDFVRARYSDGPLALVGHSFGGQLLGLLDQARDANGVLLVGAQQGYVGHWPAAEQARMQLIWRGLLPALTATAGYLPGWAGLGVDLPKGVARQWARWCTHPGYYAVDHADAPARLARFDRPVLMYSFSDDDLAPPRAVAALADKLTGTLVDHRRLTPLDVGASVGHFGFFRPQHADGLWRESSEWLLAALTGQPLPVERRVSFITAEDLRADLQSTRQGL